MVLLALRTAGYVPEDPGLYGRGLNWLLSFQCKDGGWAAFDKDVTNPLLEQVPFADHNAILDPTCSTSLLESWKFWPLTGSHQSTRWFRGPSVFFASDKNLTALGMVAGA